MTVVSELSSAAQCFPNIMYCIIISFTGHNTTISTYLMSDQNFTCRMLLFEHVMIEIRWI